MTKALKPSKPYSEIAKPDWMSDEDWEITKANMQSPDRVKSQAKAHLETYLASNGEQGFDGRAGENIDENINFLNLILTTIGRKSGQKRSTPLNFHQDGENYYLVGSLAGFEADPPVGVEPQGQSAGMVASQGQEMGSSRGGTQRRGKKADVANSSFFAQQCDSDGSVALTGLVTSECFFQ